MRSARPRSRSVTSDSLSCDWENGAVEGEDYTSAFSIGFDGDRSGTWSFAANPSLTHGPAYMVVKAATNWALYALDGALSGDWSTAGLMTPNGKNQAGVCAHLVLQQRGARAAAGRRLAADRGPRRNSARWRAAARQPRPDPPRRPGSRGPGPAGGSDRKRSEWLVCGGVTVTATTRLRAFGPIVRLACAVAVVVAASAGGAGAATLVGIFDRDSAWGHRDPFGGKNGGLYGSFNGVEIASPSLADEIGTGLACTWKNGAVVGAGLHGRLQHRLRRRHDGHVELCRRRLAHASARVHGGEGAVGLGALMRSTARCRARGRRPG